MVTELCEKKLYNTLALGYAMASWRLHDDDSDWLEEECLKMYEFFEKAPAIDWIRERMAQKMQQQAEQKILKVQKLNEQKMLEAQKLNEQKFLEAQKLNEQKFLEAQKLNEQKMLEAQKLNEQKMLEERVQNEQRMLKMNQETVVALVSERFPTLLRMAKANIRMLKEPELFQQVIVRLSLAHDVDEAEDALLSLLEKDE